TQIFRSGTGTERMRITSGGEVLIGSTGIYGGGSANESDLLVVGAPPSNDVDRGLVSFLDNRAYNTSGLGAKLMLGGSFNSSGSITFFSGLAGLKENTTDGNYAGALAFYTRANGGASSEKMRITSGGELLINTTSDAGDYKLQVNGNGYFVGSIGVNTSGQTRTISTYYGANSDGLNIFIGGGGKSSVGAVGQTYKGAYNTSVGVDALYSNTTGYYNSAMGMYALLNNTTGYQNSAMGVQALYSNTTGYYNSAMGMYA
ncbi:MAG: hypothetical protein ACOVOV_09525, partial [Dolichospermum sp.]